MQAIPQPPEEVSIILSAPPEGSPPEILSRLELRFGDEPIVQEHCLLKDPLTAEERHDVRWYLEEYWQWPYEGFAQRGAEVERLLVGIGQRLFHAACNGFEHTNLQRIQIESTLPDVLNLPWELLHDGSYFLAHRTPHPVSIVRCLTNDNVLATRSPFKSPLRVLLVTARPENTGFIDQRIIARELLDELQEAITAGVVALEFLRPPTITALQERLHRDPPVHVLHFDGHGVFAVSTVESPQGHRSQGALFFEQENGEADLIEAEILTTVLRQSAIQLAVLTACQSASSAEEDAFSSVAAQLIRGGVDAVVAMSASVLVVSAASYAEGFYRALALGTSVRLAHLEAQEALYADSQRHFHKRHLDTPGQPVHLHDWWLAHLYLHRDFILQSATHTRSEDAPHPASTILRLSDTMPAAPRYGYIGRARELLQIERQLRRCQ